MLSKILSKKVLPSKEYELSIYIKTIEHFLHKFIKKLYENFINDQHIVHTHNYNVFSFDMVVDEVPLKNSIPVMLLLGGSAYKIYGKLFNQFYDDKFNLSRILIDTVDYDFSFMMKSTFTNAIFKGYIKTILKISELFINQMDGQKDLQIITKTDIKNDAFLSCKNIVNKGDKNKIIITYSNGQEYCSIQMTIKYNYELYQIMEIHFWKNSIISNVIVEQCFLKNKCILYINNDLTILLPDIILLIQSNILSLHDRLIINNFEKCNKDYNRLAFLEYVSNIQKDMIIVENKFITENQFNILKGIFKQVHRIYKKENPNIFKLPNTICSMDDTYENKKKAYELYVKFLNLNLDEQLKIMRENT